MGRQPVGMDELVEHWTVLDDELNLVAGKRGGARLGLTLLLKYYTRYGRFPRGRAEFVDEMVDYVARQVKVPAVELGLYDWTVGADRWRNPMRTCRSISSPAAPSTTASWRRWMRHPAIWSGSRSPNARPGRSSSPRPRPRPSRATCAVSKARSAAAFRWGRWSTCSRKPCCVPAACSASPRSPAPVNSIPRCRANG
ncbi:DUF4158 domain-containing protein [Actinomadura terrae]|uniref:DUF4158 domain-containing protein n=1 Tax=Actinomadura terrae TaxID=604353 RepID=UPI0035593287